MCELGEVCIGKCDVQLVSIDTFKVCIYSQSNMH